MMNSKLKVIDRHLSYGHSSQCPSKQWRAASPQDQLITNYQRAGDAGDSRNIAEPLTTTVGANICSKSVSSFHDLTADGVSETLAHLTSNSDTIMGPLSQCYTTPTVSPKGSHSDNQCSAFTQTMTVLGHSDRSIQPSDYYRGRASPSNPTCAIGQHRFSFSSRFNRNDGEMEVGIADMANDDDDDNDCASERTPDSAISCMVSPWAKADAWSVVGAWQQDRQSMNTKKTVSYLAQTRHYFAPSQSPASAAVPCSPSIIADDLRLGTTVPSYNSTSTGGNIPLQRREKASGSSHSSNGEGLSMAAAGDRGGEKNNERNSSEGHWRFFTPISSAQDTPNLLAGNYSIASHTGCSVRNAATSTATVTSVGVTDSTEVALANAPLHEEVLAGTNFDDPFATETDSDGDHEAPYAPGTGQHALNDSELGKSRIFSQQQLASPPLQGKEIDSALPCQLLSFLNTQDPFPLVQDDAQAHIFIGASSTGSQLIKPAAKAPRRRQRKYRKKRMCELSPEKQVEVRLKNMFSSRRMRKERKDRDDWLKSRADCLGEENAQLLDLIEELRVEKSNLLLAVEAMLSS